MRPMSRRDLFRGLGGVALASTALGGSVAQASGRHDFEIVEHDIALSGLNPAHDGLRIAQISDLHVGASTPDGRIIAAIRAINELEPDLVFLTGDYVTFSRSPVPRVAWLLEGINAPTFAVLGNHDYWVAPDEIGRDIEKNGYALLRNQWTGLEVKGEKLCVIGVDDGRSKHDDVEKAFSGVPECGTRLVLAHTPPTARKFPKDAGLLCFSGHTHGGMIQIPGVTRGLADLVGQPYLRGLYQVQGNQLYVNAGLGYGKGGPAVRIGVPPELTVITLRQADASASQRTSGS